MKSKLALAFAVATLALAIPARADEPSSDDPVAVEARAHHRRGLELYDEGDFRLALVEFERAYSLVPGFKALYNIGQVHFQMSEYAKARVALERYLVEGGAQVPESRRADVAKDLETLRHRTAILTVRVNVGSADIAINSAPAGRGALEKTLVDAGPLRVEVTAPGFASRVREVTLAGGDEQTVTIELTRVEPSFVIAPSDERSLSTGAIAGWIAAGVLTAGAIGTGIAASSTASAYDRDRKAPIQGSPDDAASTLEHERNLTKGLALTTDILVASAVAVGGLSLYLTLRSGSKPSAPRLRTQGLGAAFSVGF